ncbi:hypothetical protein [Natronorubrum thiooxidans]|uniref:hypothetical protein n=1 Tax=Natronorubrum thiooxidans TaxID=308853 RepID=UPI00117E00B1|nr:hypothetical protein [Natronorubrum thiooxidans]
MAEFNRRRKDKAHDVGDSSPGTVGDSQGTFHDRIGGGPSFDPDDQNTMSESEVNEYLGQSNSKNQSKKKNKQNKKSRVNKENSERSKSNQESQNNSKRMRYARRYGDSWSTKQKMQFLQEHDVSASEMGWKLKE